MNSKLIPWLPAVSAITGIAILAATMLVYSSAQEEGAAGSYIPLITGTLSFATVLAAASYFAVPPCASRILRTAVTFVGGAASFMLALLFILLNTLGA